MSHVRRYLGLAGWIGLSLNLHAAVIVVTTTSDSGSGSLRNAVATANSGDTITFNSSLSGQTIVLAGGPIMLNQNVVIDASALADGLAISGNNASSIFTDSTNDVVLNDLDLIDGYNINGNGGGIYNGGTLILNNCTIASSTAQVGGGIYNEGTLTLNNCTVSGNVATGAIGTPGTIGAPGAPGMFFPIMLPGGTGGPGGPGGLGGSTTGGGIYNSASLSLINCTLSGNQANGGVGGMGGPGGMGGIGSPPGPLGPEGPGGNGGFAAGGGIYNDTGGSLVLINCTSSGNQANGGLGGTPTGANASGDGGGIYNIGSIAVVTNSTVANNSVSASGSGDDVYNSANLTYGGENIVQSTYNSGAISGPNPIDADPGLASLGNYGGPTQTMPPLPGSPAIDAGTDSVTNFLATDQRGYPRLAGLHVDIGPVEGVYNAAGPGVLAGAPFHERAAFQFAFTNFEDMTFTVFASTNAALPFNQWSNLGPAVETPAGSGQFGFTDSGATNLQQRFYYVASP